MNRFSRLLDTCRNNHLAKILTVLGLAIGLGSLVIGSFPGIGIAQEPDSDGRAPKTQPSDTQAKELQSAVLRLKANESGPLSKVTSSLAPLLRLKIDENRSFLALDRSSWEAKTLTEKERLEAAIDSLMSRGLDRKSAEKFAAKMATTNRSSPLDTLFTKVRVAGRMNSHARSSARTNTKWTCDSQEMTCTLNVSDGIHFFQLTELAKPNRTLIFRRSDKSLSILFIGFDWTVNVRQIDGKEFSATLLTDDYVARGKAADFVSFTKSHPELCQRVMGLLSQAGVDAPPVPSSKSVTEYVIRMIQDRSASDAMLLDKLIAKLNASEFQAREAASETIKNSFKQFEAGIAARIEKDDLSIEAKKRLREISKSQTEANKTDPRIARCAQVFQLADSPQYLVSLLDDQPVDVQKILTDHLEKFTGQDLGNDVDAWNRWASEEKAKVDKETEEKKEGTSKTN